MKRTAGGVTRADTVSVPSVDLTGDKALGCELIILLLNAGGERKKDLF